MRSRMACPAGEPSATARTRAIASHRWPCWNIVPLGTEEPDRCAEMMKFKFLAPHQDNEDHLELHAEPYRGCLSLGRIGHTETFGPGWEICQ